jgi:hypothetical protein
MTTVAIAAIVRNEADYLPDWVIFHLWQGVSRFHITVDETQGPCDDDTVGVLLRLAPLGVQIQVIRNASTAVDRQIHAYGAAGSYLRHCDWIAYLDPDEYLFDPKGRSLPFALDAMGNVAAVAVQQRVFGSNGRLDKPKISVRQAYTKRATVQCSEHKWFKTIARPFVEMTSAHGAKGGGPYVLGDGQPFEFESHGSATRIATDGLRIHHYMLKSREEFLRKRARGAISDRGDYRRFTMDYFTERDKYANAVEDLTLAEWFPK